MASIQHSCVEASLKVESSCLLSILTIKVLFKVMFLVTLCVGEFCSYGDLSPSKSNQLGATEESSGLTTSSLEVESKGSSLNFTSLETSTAL